MAALHFDFTDPHNSRCMLILERSEREWVQVLRTVGRITDSFARIPKDRQASELKQTRALRDDATRAGRHDSATYLQECIDAMTGAQE